MYVSRHSDVNLVEVAKDFVKEDDKALLLEDGGGLQSASPKAKGSSAYSPLIRFPLVLLKQPVRSLPFFLMLMPVSTQVCPLG